MLQTKSFLSSSMSLFLSLCPYYIRTYLSRCMDAILVYAKKNCMHSIRPSLIPNAIPTQSSYIRPPLEYAYECIFTKRNQGPVTDVQNVPIRLVIGLGCWLAGLLSTLNWPSDSGHFVPCTGAPPLYVQIYTHPWNPLLPLGFLIAPPPLANRTESGRGEALRPFGFLTDHVSLR